ncbi:hypothetical protein [Lentzea sp. NBRC 105346]|uniref:hypothetical protein n=1 Tax=Lentzea sp. NBRC 105346 TaxID=3032205 RepID=UPI00255433F8|nr:hypothetical protein [Lentzea sp. NBRC 105346]
MKPKKRSPFARILAVVALLLVVCLAVLLWSGELDRNDKIASVVSMFVGVAGLIVALQALRTATSESRSKFDTDQK